MINNINNAALYNPAASPQNSAADINAQRLNSVERINPVREVQPAQQSTNFRPDLAKLESIYAEQRQYISGLQSITRQLDGQLNGFALSQGNTAQNSNANSGLNSLYDLAGGIFRTNGMSGMQNYFNLFVRNPSGGFSVDLSGVSPEMREQLVAKAKEDVSENGFFGVSRTSERIFDFAKALTGGDPARMDRMQQVVDRAFASVGRMFGGMNNMPQISRDTYDAVMQRFDEFRAATEQNKQTTDLVAE
jgi:hypothetical protein